MPVELDLCDLTEKVFKLERRVNALESKGGVKSVVAAKIEKKVETENLIECPECSHRLLKKAGKPYCIHCGVEY